MTDSARTPTVTMATANTTHAATPSGVMHCTLQLDDLHDSPLQPRTTYTGLDELAESIKAEGILQPIKVRPRRNNPLRDDLVDGFEIVFGHRRRRAAQLAGLVEAECLVVAMTDAEVRAAQMAENLQRENMTALDEAAGYRAQIDRDGISQAELARRLGKSASHVAARLRLLQLTPAARQALADGRIGAEVAVLIARTGPPAVQDKALADIRGKGLSRDMEDGGARSLRDVRNFLAERYTLGLKGAIFDCEDTTLHPTAGACSQCPHRTGNAPEFADIARPVNDSRDWLPDNHSGPDVCTEPDCFQAKKTAHLKRTADALAAKGQTVIDGAKARQAISVYGQVKGAYVAASAVKAELARVRDKSAAAPQPVTILNPRNGKTVKAYRRADLEAAGVTTAAATGAGGAQARGMDYAAQRRADDEAGNAETQARTRLLAHVRQALRGRARDRDDLVMAVQCVVLASMDELQLSRLWGHASVDEFRAAIPTMGNDDLALLLLDVALVEQVDVTSRWAVDHTTPQPLLDAAARLGIDVATARSTDPAPATPAAPASTPPRAARARGDAEAAGDGGDDDGDDDGGGASTPATAARARGKAAGAARGQAAGAARGQARPVAYACHATGQTWSGRGLKPAWVKAWLANGGTLADIAVTPPAAGQARKAGQDQTDKARKAGRKVKDGAGAAGEVDRDPNTADLFEVAGH
jgi:ParB/RepB/Spo0J family partition protein